MSKTKAQLEQELTEALQHIEALKENAEEATLAENQMLVEANATLNKDLEEAKARVAELEARPAPADQSGLVAELKAQVKDLTEQLKVKEATAGSKLPTVKVGDTHHAFTTPKFRLKDGRTLTAEEAAKDVDLCTELVKAGSGLLKPVTLK